MTYVITPYVLIAAFAAAVSAVVAVIAWQRRAAPGGAPLTALMVAVGIWSAGAAMEYAIAGIPGKVFWAKVQYIGVVSTPVFFLLLAVEYSQLDRWMTRRTVALLFVVPLTTLLLTVTNEWHGLIWPSITPIGSPDANLALYTHGIGFWIGSVGYAYLLMLIGTVLLIRAAMRFPPIYRRQAALLVAAVLAPWLVNLIYVLGLSPAPGLEMTPLVLACTGMIFAWGIYRFHLLDLAPVARERLIETMADGMVVLDAQDRVVDINPAAQRFIAAPTPVQLGQPASAVFVAWPDWATCCGNARTARVELPLNDAAQRTLELSISPIYDRRGQYSGRLVVIHDITEHKAVQTKIERLNDELEARVAARTEDLAATQERFSQVITSISDHVFALLVAADGSVTTLYSSPRLLELTGFTAQELRGDFFTVVARITHPGDRAAVTAFFHRLLTAGAGELEYRWVRADRAVAWVRTSARVQAQGTDRIIFGVTSDITERKHMEQTDVEIRALAELDRLRTELVGNVSHELRTPLGLIKVASTTLLRQDVTFSPAIQQHILRGITDETNRLEHLVANLLDISRLDQQRFMLQYDLTNLNQLVTAIVDGAQRQETDDTGAAHRFVLALPDLPVDAVVDAPKIEQVLRNLIQNAIHYSPAGSTVTVTLRADGAEWELRVADEGIGIASEDQGRIFDRFYRARDVRVQHVRGAGLGLAICREIVELHGGALSVASAPEQGATIIVRIPRVSLIVET